MEKKFVNLKSYLDESNMIQMILFGFVFQKVIIELLILHEEAIHQLSKDKIWVIQICDQKKDSSTFKSII